MKVYLFCDGAKGIGRDGKMVSLMIGPAEGNAWASFASEQLAALEVAEHNARVLKSAQTNAQLARAAAAVEAKRAVFKKNWSSSQYARAIASCTLKPE